MLINSGQYDYTDVTGVTLGGNIIPALDGTSSERVLRKENECYVTEMARDRFRWIEPWHANPASPRDVLSYSRTPRVLDAGIIDQVRGEIGSRVQRSGDRSAIREDWIAPSGVFVYPYGTDEFAEFFAGCECANHDFDTARIPYGDDWRTLYYDLAQMKRFILRSLEVGGMKYADINAAVTAMTDPGPYAYHMTGPIVTGDGDTTEYVRNSGGQWSRTYTGYARISGSREWSSGGSIVETSWTSADLSMLVNTPFYSRYSGSQMSSNAHLGNSLPLWIHINGDVQWYDEAEEGGGGGSMFRGFVTGFSMASPTTKPSAFGGWAQRMYSIGTVGNEALLTLVQRELQSVFPKFASRPYRFEFFTYFYADSGVLQNVESDLPSSWTWRPPEDNE